MSIVSVRRELRLLIKRILMLLPPRRDPVGPPILLYHSVDRTGSIISTAPERLRSHLSLLKEMGWRGLTAPQFLDRLGEPRPDERELLITFDDGYGNFCTDAVPVLREMGFPATVFVVTDRVGRTASFFADYRDDIGRFVEGLGFASAQASDFERDLGILSRFPLMSWAQLEQVSRLGFDVAPHGASHRFLAGLSEEAVCRDVSRSVEAIKARVGRCPPVFAYPYGLSDETVVQAVARCGMRAAFLAEYFGVAADPFHLGRIQFSDAATALDIRFALSGGLYRYAKLSHGVRSLVARLRGGGGVYTAGR